MAIVLLVAAQAPPAQPPRDTVRKSAATASISGRVTDAVSGRPLPDAVVRASSAFPLGSADAPRLEAVTGPDGQYEISGIQPGEYRVFVSPDDFCATHLSRPFGAAGAEGATLPVPVVLAAGERREHVDVALPRARAIEGRVVDEFGEPMADISVQAQLSPGSGGSGRQVQTDERGLFRVFHLSPGRYRICAQPLDRMPPRERVTANDTRYVRTCVPAAGGPLDGIEVASRDVGGIEIQLRRSGAYTLSGQVLTQAGDVARDAHVAVSRVEAGGAAVGVQAETTDGTFVARGVTSGEYRIEARTGGRGRPDEGEAGLAIVTVDGSDVSGVVVATSSGATVSGRVVIDGGELPAAAARRLTVVLTYPGGEPREPRIVGASTRATVAEDFTFTLNHVFNRHFVGLTGLPDGWIVGSVMFKGEDITARYVALPTAREPDALRITITDRTAELHVRVVDAGGAAAAGTAVVLPADPAMRLGGARLYGRRRLPSGAVDFGYFPPGDYLVVALPEQALATLFRDRAAGFDALAKIAQKITLGAKEVRTVDVVVTSLPADR
jgi:protocatechuate 3,4-dioxygenase beta subunit